MHKKYDNAMKAKVIDMKKKGATNAQIRDSLDISETRISSWWKQHTDINPEDKKMRTGNRGL